MLIRFFLVFAVSLLCGGLAGAEQNTRIRTEDRDRLYQERLTPEERQLYREKLWELKTEAERERFREAQRQMLDERARDLRLSPVPEEKKPAAETERKWPNDGLRRWPQDRSADNGLRRWKGRNMLAGKEEPQEAALNWRDRGAMPKGEKSEGVYEGKNVFDSKSHPDRKTP